MHLINIGILMNIKKFIVHRTFGWNTDVHLNDDDEETETCNVKLWKTRFYPKSQNCIIPVHNILCQFVLAKYKVSSN